MKTKGNRILINTRLLLCSLTTACILAFSGAASAQKVIPDSTSFLIGDQVKVALELETQKGDQVEWPVFGDTLTRSIEIIAKSKPDTSMISGGTRILNKLVLTITSFDTGFIVLPPVTFKVKRAGGEVSALKSEPVLLEVKNVKVDPSKDIRDIKPLLNAPYTLRDFLPWMLLAAAAGLLGTLLWFYIRSRKRNKPLIKLPSKPQKPPHQLAIDQLDELQREQVWQKGDVKLYYTRMTDILREYFGRRFGVNATEMTSDEILFAMKDHFTEVNLLGDLRKILTLSDLAKFAKGQPIATENELSMTYAKSIVLNTATAPALSEATGIAEEKGTDGEEKTE